MKEILIAQDNRLTTARYELSLIEKRIMYYIIKEVRKRHIDRSASTNLFDNMIMSIPIADLAKETHQIEQDSVVRKGLKALRLRSFEYEDVKNDYWVECGFINYSEITKGVAEIEVSKKLMPFLVELSSNFTPYSLNIAMSLKSKWSQRMYEMCQKWQGAEGFRISVEELRKSFVLENKYPRFALLNEFVLQIAKRELKDLFDQGQCDVYFDFSEERKGRTVEYLRFKLFRKADLNVKTTKDLLLELIPFFQGLFETTKKPKNDTFINQVIIKLQLHPNLIEPLNVRVKKLIAKGIDEETPILMRYILNEDIIGYEPVSEVKKPIKSPKKESVKEEVKPNDAMATLFKLADSKSV
jgi:hypothetical protein